MICDELSEEEIHQAYLIYAALHGLNTNEDHVRERISNYLKGNQPDEWIDEAILAYAEDCIVAPPDVILTKWGSSRYYELDRSPHRLARHRTCEAWFEYGCRFLKEEDTPRLVHFWTAFELHAPSIAYSRLCHGTRLSFALQPEYQVQVIHREWGELGNLPPELSVTLHEPPLRDRKFLALVDKRETTYQPPTPASEAADCIEINREHEPRSSYPICKLQVTSGARDVLTGEFLEYAVEAFLADRNKC